MWTAYQQMLEDDPEQIVHLGDYRNHHALWDDHEVAINLKMFNGQ